MLHTAQERERGDEVKYIGYDTMNKGSLTSRVMLQAKGLSLADQAKQAFAFYFSALRNLVNLTSAESAEQTTDGLSRSNIIKTTILAIESCV